MLSDTIKVVYPDEYVVIEYSPLYSDIQDLDGNRRVIQVDFKLYNILELNEKTFEVNASQVPFGEGLVNQEGYITYDIKLKSENVNYKHSFIFSYIINNIYIKVSELMNKDLIELSNERQAMQDLSITKSNSSNREESSKV